MPTLKAASMREMTVDELHTRVGELREELFNLRFRNTLKQLDNPLRIREGRREMARLLTVLNEKQGSVSAATAPAPAPAKASAATAPPKAAKPRTAKTAMKAKTAQTKTAKTKAAKPAAKKDAR